MYDKRLFWSRQGIVKEELPSWSTRIYVEVEDGERLTRALQREKSQSVPKYEEMCRRFLADSQDFSKEKLEEAGISRAFYNNELDSCIQEIKQYIQENDRL